MKKVKCAFQDYTEENLPSTRRDVFKNCYKERFAILLGLGLICLVLVTPFVLVSFLKESYLLDALEKIEQNAQLDAASVYFGAELVFGMIHIVCYAIFALFFSGVVQVLRQMLWDEPLFFRDDFKNGLKSNAIRFATAALLLAAIKFLLNLYVAGVIRYVLNGIFVSFVLPTAAWYALQGVYYKAPTISAIKNAEVLYLKTVPATLLLLLATIVPFWIVNRFVSMLAVRYAAVLALALLYVVPLTMCWMLYACHTFDELVNKEHNPQIYRKGMQPEE